MIGDGLYEAIVLVVYFLAIVIAVGFLLVIDHLERKLGELKDRRDKMVRDHPFYGNGQYCEAMLPGGRLTIWSGDNLREGSLAMAGT